MLNDMPPHLVKCPCCGAEFTAPDPLALHMEIRQHSLDPDQLRLLHPEVNEDEEHPMRDSHKNPNTHGTIFGMEE